MSLNDLQDALSVVVEDAKRFFKPGMLVTIIAYQPSHPGRELMIGEGKPDELVEVLQRMKLIAEYKPAPTTDKGPEEP